MYGQFQDRRRDSKREGVSSYRLVNYREARIVNREELHFGWDWVQDSFKTLVDRKIRERRRDERRLAQQRTTKHQLQARNSCVTDGRSYRVARRLPVPAPARFDWKTLIPVEQLNKVRSACFKKFRDHQFKRWVSAKKAASRNLFHLLRGLTR